MKRFILGKRGSEWGVFISPPGIDAAIAPASSLLLHVTSATSQIAMQGVVAPSFPKVVPHILGYAPIVLPNLISDKITAGFPYVRPYDNSYGDWIRSRIISEPTQFTVLQEYIAGGGSIIPAAPLDVNYFVYNKQLPL